MNLIGIQARHMAFFIEHILGRRVFRLKKVC